MLSRRYFLVSSGTVLLASLTATRASESESGARLRTCLITASDLPECCTFESALRRTELQLRVDSGEYLADLSEIIERQAPQLISGLTRHSDFIVLSQLAYERGFVRDHCDSHACRAGHRLLSWAFRRA